MARLTTTQRTSLTILIAALGYFVDVFDIQLFSVLRVSSLKSLGLSADQITNVGAQLLNWQMAGMLLGGILWGILGDRKGRVYVLFGTILLYSVANIANAFVTTMPAYAAARFFTGLGLAGEIGAGITLASELLSPAVRTYATSAIVTCGVMGPVVASFVADRFDWREAYIGGGILGLLLLFLRVSVNESGLFRALGEKENAPRGQFLTLFTNRKRFARYICCIGTALPIWFTVGVLCIFSPEIGLDMHTDTPLKAATALIASYGGTTIGNFMSGLLSQLFESRRKVMAAFMLAAGVATILLLTRQTISATGYYGFILLAGFLTGWWTLFMTTTAEQFGTNLRATAATTAPNFVRASMILNTMLIVNLKPVIGFISSTQIDAAICYALALLALWKLPESFGRDLDFIEK